ncbi:peptide/nickel transport system substrate-binding protein [Stella humosa]|uniref:Peptide/nickel transport system substrate-binding protein n=1 Tax=Stella humosa TaxID=94 RepID=A0A3N1KXU1_9PROT|nr:ABC transporter substrate-binding protein [Stella humosa]ROP83400.1 peptide/nickel transport system substrate-binding protein [Stella humosa]BBK29816.1 ABC transporter substrate-binding protein [Stella humosa]
MKRWILSTAVVLALAAHGAADAKTFRFSMPGDINGLDPHLNNESPTNAMKNNLYETLIFRDYELKLHPSLATEWQQTAPTVWRFKLRPGVKFHDGTPFTADDVVFSVARNNHAQSDLATYSSTIAEVKKIDDLTVDIVTNGPDPVLLQNLPAVFIMSKTWSEKNNTAAPVRGIVGNESYANRHVNGTGPFKLAERVPDTRTVLEPNKEWWGKVEHNLTRVELRPIANAATRVAALLSGEIDMMHPVPLQDVPRLKRTAGVKVLEGPELRTIFFGMDQHRDELMDMPGTGKNPFKDKRVRQAFYQAIDINAIQRVVMRGASTPTGIMIAPGIVGFSKEMNERYPFDPEGAKKLLTEAGYPNGFPVTLDCPNDRYVNDEAICQAVVPMLTRIGVQLKLNSQTKSKHFDKIGERQNWNTSFYMLGWTPGSYDAHNMLYNIISMGAGPGSGSNNSGRYNNPRVNDLTARIGVETDQEKRSAMIQEAMKIHKEDFGHIPLHQQALAWAIRDTVVTLPQAPNDALMVRFVKMK